MIGNIIAILAVAYALYQLFRLVRRGKPTCSCGCAVQQEAQRGTETCFACGMELIQGTEACPTGRVCAECIGCTTNRRCTK